MPNYAPYRNACNCVGQVWETMRLGDLHSNVIPNNFIPVYQYNGLVHNKLTASVTDTVPYERYSNACGAGCENNTCDESNTAICVPWIGNAANQYNYSFPPPNTATSYYNTYTTESLQTDCQAKYFKNVAAKRRWHGSFGWTSHYSSWNDIICTELVEDMYGYMPGDPDYTDTYAQEFYESYQPYPDQTKYCSVGFSCYIVQSSFLGSAAGSVYATAGGGNSVNATTGEQTSTCNTFGSEYNNELAANILYTSQGNGYTYDGTNTYTYTHGLSSPIDSTFVDYHLGNYPTLVAYPELVTYPLDGFIAWWNSSFLSQLNLITNPNSYSDTQSDGAIGLDGGGTINTCNLYFNRTNTVVTYDFTVTVTSYVDWVEAAHYTNESAGTITLGSPNPYSAVEADTIGLLAQWTMTDDNLYPWRIENNNVAPLVTRDEAGGNVALNVGFTPHWVDDYRIAVADIYGTPPWQVASPSSSAWNMTWAATPWVDTNAWYFYYANPTDLLATSILRSGLSGNIIGAPLPAGYNSGFNFNYPDWQSCIGDDGLDVYLYGWGSTTPYWLPQNCTQWTNNADALITAAGAWQTYNLGSSDTIAPDTCCFMQKHCEIKQYLPSQNFARPAFNDKYSFDEAKVYCFISQSGNQVALSDTSGNPITSFPDLTGYWGGTDVGGFYPLAGYSSGYVTLGATASALPTGFSEDGFGKLRFPNCPAILGRTGITTWTGSNPITMSLQTPNPYLCLLNSGSNDYVDICNSQMTPIIANTKLTRLNDTTYFISSSFVNGGLWIVPHVLNDLTASGATNWFWNDTDSKGDYAITAWTRFPRNVAEPTRINTTIAGCATDPFCASCNPLGSSSMYVPSTDVNGFSQSGTCIKAVSCCPNVICISPNSESFKNGVTYPFPQTGSFIADEKYGSMWISNVQQAVFDPLWQAPHTICSVYDDLTDDTVTAGNIVMVMDDGTCQVDTVDPVSGIATHYYPHAPLVECRVSMPGGAPQMPVGTYIGFISPMTASMGNTAGDVLNPPMAGATTFVGQFLDNACLCVSGSGRFTPQYSIYNCSQ